MTPAEWLEQPRPRLRSCHFHLPVEMKRAFERACALRRNSQAACLAEAIRALLAKLAATQFRSPPPILPPGPTTQIVPRVPAVLLESLAAIAKETRIPVSDYLREALNDWLEKQGAAPWLRPEASLDGPVTLRVVGED